MARILPYAAFMVSLTVNNTGKTFDGDSNIPLLCYLRDELSLTGTNCGCGIAQCGTCTGHVDGASTRASHQLMSALEGRAVTTIEGLHAAAAHPAQMAWRTIDAPPRATRRTQYRKTRAQVSGNADRHATKTPNSTASTLQLSSGRIKKNASVASFCRSPVNFSAR